jgi:hypothetical protein
VGITLIAVMNSLRLIYKNNGEDKKWVMVKKQILSKL